MKGLSKNVWVLTVGLSLMLSCSSLVVFLGGIIGTELAPSGELSTLPVASIIVGTALFTIPVALLMKKLGRRATFLLMFTISIGFSLLGAYSIYVSSFYLFCFSLLLMGMSIATLNQFRFAAMESVKVDLIPLAASTVLLGGIAAAYIGPEVALAGRTLLSVEYVGSFLLLSGLFALGLVTVSFYRNTQQSEENKKESGRSLSTIVRQPVFLAAVASAAVGYAIMSFIMTATPVSMHVMDGHSLEDTKWVIQSHILAMFLPSLVSGYFIKKIGNVKMIFIGIVAFVVCKAIAYSGHQVAHYWWSLLLLGVGWNFLFIGGTTLLPFSYETNERFKVQAVNDFIIFGTQAISALSAGFIVHALGWETLLLISIPFLVIPVVAVIYFSMDRSKSQTTDESQEIESVESES
ncbi:MAG: MFS transporter [Cyclobacteriaceae bacterium]